MNDSFKDLNTDIDNYTSEELLNLLELNDPSKEEIKNKINFLNNNYFKNNMKLFAFFNKSSDKFRPIKNNSFVYDCEKNKETIDNLDSQKIIDFVEKNI